MANITYSNLAKTDLAEIWLYIAEDSPENAENFIRYIERKCRLLAESPEVGREFPEFSEGLFGFPIKNYMVFYKIENEGIVIARVLHAKRNLPSLFE